MNVITDNYANLYHRIMCYVLCVKCSSYYYNLFTHRHFLSLKTGCFSLIFSVCQTMHVAATCIVVRHDKRTIKCH